MSARPLGSLNADRVLGMVACGATNADIARRAGVGVRAVASWRKRNEVRMADVRRRA